MCLRICTIKHVKIQQQSGRRVKMIERNHHGEIRRSHRRINTRVSGELLVGDGWEGVAFAELKRLALEVGIYHEQLEGKPGHEETGHAAQSLKDACLAIDRAYGSEDGDNDGPGLKLQPDG
jgi:hypothetical protein